MAMSSAERFGFECESTGTVHIDVGVIHKDFGIHGVTLQGDHKSRSQEYA